MELIERDELKAKLDREDDFKLVMVLGEWTFKAKHIPGSMNIFDPTRATELLSPEDDIVLYCSNPECPASTYTYHLLTSGGFEHVKRYAGGNVDWEQAGLRVEGTHARPLGKMSLGI